MTSPLTARSQQDSPRGQALAELLHAEFSPALSAAVVETTVAQAKRDLTGQIVPEAWEEMVYRLAHHRLAQAIPEIGGP